MINMQCDCITNALCTDAPMAERNEVHTANTKARRWESSEL
jgi:hypothetical protein